MSDEAFGERSALAPAMSLGCCRRQPSAAAIALANVLGHLCRGNSVVQRRLQIRLHKVGQSSGRIEGWHWALGNSWVQELVRPR